MAQTYEDTNYVQPIAQDLKCVYLYYKDYIVCIKASGLGLACFCGESSTQLPTDVIVKLSSSRSKPTHVSSKQAFYVQKGGQNTKFIFHVCILNDQSTSEIVQTIVKCLIESNTRECEDIMFDVDDLHIDPTKLGEIFRDAVLLYLSCEDKRQSGKEIRLQTMDDSYFHRLYKPLIKLTESDQWTVASYDDEFATKLRYFCTGKALGPYKYLENLNDTEQNSKNLRLVYTDDSGTRNLISLGVPEPIRKHFFVSDRFHIETEYRYVIKKIFIIESETLRKRYTQYEDNLKCKNKIKTSELWHGCPATSRFKIANTGFEVSRAGQNGFCYYGYGIYFSTTAKRPSMLYSTVDEDNKNKYIFLSEVITGDFTIGREEYKQPPKKHEGDGLQDTTSHGGARVKKADIVTHYHSCVDDVEQPTTFVVFENDAACPKYMIEFTEKN